MRTGAGDRWGMTSYRRGAHLAGEQRNEQRRPDDSGERPRWLGGAILSGGRGERERGSRALKGEGLGQPGSREGKESARDFRPEFSDGG